MGDSSKALSPFPLQTRAQTQVNDETFNLFHTIDRELFTRLTGNLGRDPGESIQVMAFWMFLEREASDMKLIKRMLSLPSTLLNELADEACTCLKCVESDRYEFGDGINGVHHHEITLLPNLLSRPSIANLRLLHENRITVLRGVTKIINNVCSRAFRDMLERVQPAVCATAIVAAGGSGWKAGPRPGGGVPVQFVGASHEVGESSREAERRGGGGGGVAPPVAPLMYHPRYDAPFVPLPNYAAAGGLIGTPPPQPGFPPDFHRPPPMVGEAVGILVGGSFPAYDFVVQRQMLNNELILGEMLSRNLSINNSEEEEILSPADDRTIFLTFSKGYPISEDEVREFFTRKFGDCIEELIMQEVGEDEQVLYARMVVRSAESMNRIVGQNKAKYSINGKHVWARKYLKRQQQQQQQQLNLRWE